MADTAATAAIQARLDALRTIGAAARDPVAFAYLDALARRAATQSEPVRRTLMAKIDAAADELAGCPAPATHTAPATTSPLAELLAYIGRQAHAQPEAVQDANEAAAPGDQPRQAKTLATTRSRRTPELKSVTYFRDEWSKLSTEQQLTQTLAQAPDNAGPMNSQHLVLRSLQLMRDIAPDYLHGFMSYIDALIWLEHAVPAKAAAGRPAASEGAAAKRSTKAGAKNR